MKSFICFSILALFSLLQAEEFPAQEVMEMAERDFEARKKWVLTQDRGEIRAQEIENTARLKEIFASHRLPSGYESGDLVDAIQQLVLHSSDLPFQIQSLEMFSSAGDLWSESLDVLTDRVLLRQGLAQRYGTHFRHEGSSLLPYPIENMEKLDELREEIDEPPLANYLEIMRGIDRAIAENNDGDLYKIVFNMMNDFDKNPADYLYYASFEPNDQPQEDGGFLSFEDPALAASYAFCKACPPFTGDAFYEEATQDVGQHLSVLISPQSVNDAVVLVETPLYIYIVPRGNSQPHQPYQSTFLNRLLISSLKAEPIAEIQCASVLEALILGGSKLKISGAGLEYEYKDSYIRDKMQCVLFFDATLENEGFDPV